MSNIKVKNNVFFGLVLISLPISIKFNSIFLILALFIYLFKLLKERKYKNIKYYIISFFFFFVQFISFLFSENKEIGIKMLVLYSSFLIYPIIFSNFSSKKSIKVIEWLFWGTAIIISYGIIMFTYEVVILKTSYNYGKAVQLFLKYVPHHVYLSMFIIISTFGMINTIFDNKKKRFLFFFIPVFYLALILLSSRMAIFIAVLVMPVLCYFFLLKKLSRRKTYLLLFSFFIFFIFLGFNNQFAKDKIVHTYYELAGISMKEKSFSGVSYRKKIWYSSVRLIKKSPYLGYGIGDVQKSLDNNYNENNHDNIIGLNTHNQYLQFALNYGIPLTLLILSILVNLIRKLFIKKHFFLLLSWFVLFMFSFTETILNRQWGVVLFAFILNYSIYINSKNKVGYV